MDKHAMVEQLTKMHEVPCVMHTRLCCVAAIHLVGLSVDEHSTDLISNHLMIKLYFGTSGWSKLKLGILTRHI